MDYQVIWASSAREDLRALFDYISADDTDAAMRVAKYITASTRRLECFPHLGRVVPEFGWDNLREIIARPYRIIYRVKASEQQVQIVRIWHGSRGHPIVS